MNIEELPGGAKAITPVAYLDSRGQVFEAWQAERYREAGITDRFVQSTVVLAEGGSMRGLHYQAGLVQAKLVTVLQGWIWDVFLDIRPGSESFGKLSTRLIGTGQQIYLPGGFAHGFLTPPLTQQRTIVTYLVSSAYDPSLERTINIATAFPDGPWPVSWGVPAMSERDKGGEAWADYRERVGK